MKYIKRFFSIVSLLIMMLLVPVWIIYFLVLAPDQISNIKSVIIPIVDFLGISAILTAYRKTIIEEITKTKKLSNALLMTVEKEWVVQTGIWILLLFTIILFIYVMPVFKITVKIQDEVIPEDIKINLIYTVGEDSTISNLPEEDNDRSIYTSERCLSWGEPLKILVESNLAKETTGYQWTFPAITELKKGIFIKVNVPTNITRINVFTTPDDAEAMIYFNEKLDSPFIKTATYITDKNKPFTIGITSEKYEYYDTSFVPYLDTHNLAIKLTPRRGSITLRTFSEGGRKVDAMSVYLNNALLNQKSWEKIFLSPGTYQVYMIKENDVTHFTDTFNINIRSRKHEIDTVTAYMK